MLLDIAVCYVIVTICNYKLQDVKVKLLKEFNMSRQILSKDGIIKTSIQLLEAGQEISFSNIAQALGTRSQALYSYFPNQIALSYGIIAWLIKNLCLHLQQKLFGQTGINGIVAFATEVRTLALEHFELTRLILKMPRTQQFPEVTAAYDQLRLLFNQLLATEFTTPNQQLLASRWIRDLTIGDIVNVGTGWFADKSFSADQSFQKLLQQSLYDLANT